MSPIEAFAWFCIGAGSSLLLFIAVLIITTMVKLVKRRNKFRDYVESLKSFSEQLNQINQKSINESREISELTFRDKTNKLCTVKIIVDHNIKVHDADSLMKMVERAQSSADGEEFIFSGYAAEQIRSRGLELDDIVREALKASGRIA